MRIGQRVSVERRLCLRDVAVVIAVVRPPQAADRLQRDRQRDAARGKRQQVAQAIEAGRTRRQRELDEGRATSKIRLRGDGPKDAQVTTGVWLTPGFDQSQTPPGKIFSRRAASCAENVAA